MSIYLLNETDFPNIKEQWNSLLRASSNDEFFLTWEWVFVWWTVYGKNRKLLILLIKDENENLVGIAPLYVQKEKLFGFLKFNKIQFLGTDSNVCPEYLNIVIKQGSEKFVINEILDYFKKNEKSWDIISLSEIIKSHTITNYILQISKIKKIPAFAKQIKTPCVYIKLPSDWNTLLQTLSQNFKFNIRKGRKNISQIANSEIEFYLNEEFLSEKLNDLFFLHNKRMRRKGKDGKFNLETYKTFHSKLIKMMSHYKLLSILKIDQLPVAILYGFMYRQKIYMYQSGFDPDSLYTKYSIIQVLLSYLIEKSITLGCKEFDFLRGKELYKYRWTNLEKSKESIFIFNTSRLTSFLLLMEHKSKLIIKKIWDILTLKDV